jgi:hypothetical protein
MENSSEYFKSIKVAGGVERQGWSVGVLHCHGGQFSNCEEGNTVV